MMDLEQMPGSKRAYAFDAWVEIDGVRGPACIERMARPPRNCARASVRVIVRWEGRLRRGTIVPTSAGAMILLRMFPMSPRARIAHLLCGPAASHTPNHAAPSAIGALS